MATIELRSVSIKYEISDNTFQRMYDRPALNRRLEDMPVRVPGGILALNEVSLTVPDGQTYVVLGPSGCGKSTLLRVVAGIDPNYTGQVLYDGQDVQNIPPKDRYIGMVFQNYALYPHFKNQGNLSFFFRMHKIKDEEANERIRITSEMMGIGFEELLPRRPGTLSGGQKQRVAIARAIVRGPRLFLFDEPLSNLDAKLRVQTRSEIKRLLHRFNITTLYVTHDQNEALSLADQIVILRGGQVEQIGTAQELLDRPASAFVAGFFGQPPMNLFPGGSVEAGCLVLSEARIPLPETIRTAAAVTLGARPEAITLEGGSAPKNGIRLRGEVDSLEPDFARHITLARIRSGEQTFLATSPLDSAPPPGENVEAVLDPAQLHFFDAATGKRLA